MFCILSRSGRLAGRRPVCWLAAVSRGAPHLCPRLLVGHLLFCVPYTTTVQFLSTQQVQSPCRCRAASAQPKSARVGASVAPHEPQWGGSAPLSRATAAPRRRHRTARATAPAPRRRRAFPPKNARLAPRAVDAPAPADLRQDADGQDHHAGRRAERHDRQRQTKNPGQGGHPAGPAAPHLRRQAARGRPHALRLQHPERKYITLSAKIARRRPRPFVVDDGR